MCRALRLSAAIRLCRSTLCQRSVRRTGKRHAMWHLLFRVITAAMPHWLMLEYVWSGYVVVLPTSDGLPVMVPTPRRA